jgi:O-antigen/teichoic acid export membrane protein
MISAGPALPVAAGFLLFAIASAGWGVFPVHDFLLVALGKPWWAVWRNAIFAVVRLALLVFLGGALALGSFGIVLSWIGPVVVWIIVGSLVIFVLARRASERATGGKLPSRSAMIAFLAPTAVGQAGGALLYNQVPILVNLRFGPETGAVFFIAWQAVAVIDLAGMFFMNSLAVTVAREPHRVRELAAAARRRLLGIFLPMLAVGAALAHPLLLIFGEDYAQGADVLRLLLLGLAFRLVVAHELGVRQATGAAMSYARLQLSSSILVVLAALVTPVTGAGVSALVPVAIGYIAVQVVCAVVVMFMPASRRFDVEVARP